MFIEVVIENDEPKIYRLDKSRLSIGSLPESDIYVRDKEVSRRHLTIEIDEGICYITDLGSTNGTFIEEQRLEPGVKIEFPQFANIRLGSKTLISIVQPDENQVANQEFPVLTEDNLGHDRTRTISRSILNQVTTQDLVKKKEAAKLKAEKRKKKERRENLKTYAFFALLFAAFVGYNQWSKIENEVLGTSSAAVPVPAPSKQRKQIKKDLRKVEESKLVNKDLLSDFLIEKKCFTVEEKKLCEAIKSDHQGYFGVTKLNSMYLVFINANTIQEEAKNLLSTEERDARVERLMSLIYIRWSLANPAIQEIIGQNDISFIFYQSPSEQEHQLLFAMTLKPQYLNELSGQLNDSQFLVVKKIGMDVFRFTEKYLTIY